MTSNAPANTNILNVIMAIEMPSLPFLDMNETSDFQQEKHLALCLMGKHGVMKYLFCLRCPKSKLFP